MKFVYYCWFFIIFGCYVQKIIANNFDNYYNGLHGYTSTTPRNPNAVRCVNIKTQPSVDIKQILGLWYGCEIIVHTNDVPGVYEYDSCVIVHLADVTDQMEMNTRDYNYNGYSRRNNYQQQQQQQHQQHQQQQHQQHQQQHNYQPTHNPNYIDDHSTTKYLRLVWSERDDNLEYTFNYTAHLPGLWHNIVEQRGSFVAQNQYQQFQGTVQVVKAVNDHLVLTFCGNEQQKPLFYTIVLSRSKLGLSSDELRSIRRLLSHRGLNTETVRKVCNSAFKFKSSAVIIFILLSIYAILYKFYK